MLLNATGALSKYAVKENLLNLFQLSSMFELLLFRHSIKLVEYSCLERLFYSVNFRISHSIFLIDFSTLFEIYCFPEHKKKRKKSLGIFFVITFVRIELRHVLQDLGFMEYKTLNTVMCTLHSVSRVGYKIKKNMKH